MREWLMADIFLISLFIGLLESGYIWYTKNKKVAIAFCIAAVITIVFILGNILYFNIVKSIFT